MKNIKQKYIYGGLVVLFIFGLAISSINSTSANKVNTTASVYTVWNSFLNIFGMGEALSSEKSILSYKFNRPVHMVGEIDQVNRRIFVEVPLNVMLSDLVPIITVSPGATVSPGSGVKVDYFNIVRYTVTAQDGSTQIYKVYAFGIPEVTIPTPISTCEELQGIHNNSSNDYQLVNDIDCSMTKNWNGGAGFVPIGYSGSNPSDAFRGHLDGNGYTISGLYMRAFSSGIFNGSRIWNSYIGLFGALSGSVSNLNVVGADIGKANDWGFTPIASGGLVGSLEPGGSITNCSFSGKVNIYRGGTVGGLVGRSYGNVKNSYSSGSVYSNTRSSIDFYDGIGGLVGELVGASVTDSYSNMNVTSVNRDTESNYNRVGGLVGLNSGTITNSYFSGKVSEPFPNKGGKGCLVGGASGVTTNSYCDTSVSGVSDISAGGVGKTTAEMKATSTYLGWNFDNTWYMTAGDYPRLGVQTQKVLNTKSKILTISVTGGIGGKSSNSNINYTNNTIRIGIPAGTVVNNVSLQAEVSAGATLTSS